VLHEERAEGAASRSRRESASPPGVSDIATTALASGAGRGAAVWAGDRDAVAAAATAERLAITDYPFGTTGRPLGGTLVAAVRRRSL
jgi:hypothetical protein